MAAWSCPLGPPGASFLAQTSLDLLGAGPFPDYCAWLILFSLSAPNPPPPGDLSGHLLAYLSLSPVFVIVGFVTLIIFKRELHTVSESGPAQPSAAPTPGRRGSAPFNPSYFAFPAFAFWVVYWLGWEAPSDATVSGPGWWPVGTEAQLTTYLPGRSHSSGAWP